MAIITGVTISGSPRSISDRNSRYFSWAGTLTLDTGATVNVPRNNTESKIIPTETGIYTVSYTHLTLPTNREV